MIPEFPAQLAKPGDNAQNPQAAGTTVSRWHRSFTACPRFVSFAPKRLFRPWRVSVGWPLVLRLSARRAIAADCATHHVN